MLEQIQMPKFHLEYINEDLRKISAMASFIANQLDLEHRHEFDKVKPIQHPAMTLYQLTALVEMLEAFAAERVESLERFLLKEPSDK